MNFEDVRVGMILVCKCAFPSYFKVQSIGQDYVEGVEHFGSGEVYSSADDISFDGSTLRVFVCDGGAVLDHWDVAFLSEMIESVPTKLKPVWDYLDILGKGRET